MWRDGNISFFTGTLSLTRTDRDRLQKAVVGEMMWNATRRRSAGGKEKIFLEGWTATDFTAQKGPTTIKLKRMILYVFCCIKLLQISNSCFIFADKNYALKLLFCSGFGDFYLNISAGVNKGCEIQEEIRKQGLALKCCFPNWISETKILKSNKFKVTKQKGPVKNISIESFITLHTVTFRYIDVLFDMNPSSKSFALVSH